MTVSTTKSRNVKDGNDVTTSFPFDFIFFDNSEIVVTLVEADGTETVKALTTDYTLSGGSGATGTVTTTSFTPATGEKLVIERVSPYTQGLDLSYIDGLPSESIEQRMDKTVLLVQQVLDIANRSIKVPITEDTASPTDVQVGNLLADRTNKYLAFDGSGNVELLAGVSTDVDVSDKLVTPTDASTQVSLANLVSDHGTVLNVKAFGATGDGTTDDAAAIGAAVTALAQGDTLYFPAGTYKVSSATLAAYASGVGWSFTVDNVRVLGAGRERTSIELTGSTETGVFYKINGSGLHIEGINVVGNNEATADSAVGSAVAVYNTSANDYQDLTVRNCSFSNFKGAGWVRVVVSGNGDFKNIRVENNRFSGGSDRNPAAAGVAANQIYLQASGGTGYVENYWICRNYCEASELKGGIHVQNQSRYGVIDGNLILNAGQTNSSEHAYALMVYNASVKVAITNNVVIDGYTCGMYLLDLTDSVVANNYVQGQEETNISTLDRGGIAVSQGIRVAVVGNTVKDCYYGISLRPGGDHAYTVTGNHVEGGAGIALLLRANSAASYKGSVIAGNYFESGNQAIRGLLGGSYYWTNLVFSGCYIKGSQCFNATNQYSNWQIIGCTMEATARAMALDNTVLGTVPPYHWTLADCVVRGDMTNIAVQLGECYWWTIKGLHFEGQATAAAYSGRECPYQHFSGISFDQVTTLYSTTVGVDYGIDTPAYTTLIEEGAFIQNLAPSVDGNGRIKIGWRFVGGSWRTEFVSSATWV